MARNGGVLSLALAALLVQPVAAQEDGAGKQALRYQPTTAGQVTAWRLTSASKGDVVVKQGEQELQRQELEIEMTLDYQLQEQAAEGPVGVYEVQLERIKLEGQGPGALNAEMTLQGMSMPDGRFVPADDAPELSELLRATFAAPVERMRLPAAGGPVTSENLGSDAYRQLGQIDVPAMVLLMQPSFPEDGRALAPGERWKSKRRLPLGLELAQPVEIELEYELLEVRDGQARFRASGRCEVEGVDATNSNGQRLHLERLVYGVDAQLAFDAARGRAQGGEMTIEIELDLVPQGAPAGLHAITRMPAPYKLAPRSQEPSQEPSKE